MLPGTLLRMSSNPPASLFAKLYNTLNPWMECDDFYLDLVMSAGAVLDVGCGTGTLLHRARQNGHVGRLCGLDPNPAMLDHGRTRPDIEWVLADAASAQWQEEFVLAVMTGHAFQCLITDDEVRDSLNAIRSALVDGGRFAFETRNPAAKAWQRWTTGRETEVVAPTGETVRIGHHVEPRLDGDVVYFGTVYESQAWTRPYVSEGRLRFLSPNTLARFLSDADLAIETQFGNWNRDPITDSSPEIITIVRRVR